MDQASAPSREIQIILLQLTRECSSCRMNPPYNDFPVFYFSAFPSSNHPFQYFCLLEAVKIKSYIENI